MTRRTSVPVLPILASLLAVLALSACETRITFDPPETDDVRVTAEVSAGFYIVRVPESRPASGIDVRRDDGRGVHIPPGHYPPPGRCRIWEPGVPPGLQGPPGDCDDLERRVPEGAYLVYG